MSSVSFPYQYPSENQEIQNNLIANFNYRIDDKCNVVCSTFSLVLSKKKKNYGWCKWKCYRTVTVIFVLHCQLIFYKTYVLEYRTSHLAARMIWRTVFGKTSILGGWRFGFMWTRWLSIFLKNPFCQASIILFILFIQIILALNL